MVQAAGSPGRSARPPRVKTPARPEPAPTRPELGGEGFAARIEVGDRPRSVATSVGLWLASIAAGAFALVVVVLAQEEVRARFSATVLAQDPTTAADVVADAARFAFLAAGGSLALVLVLHLVLTLRMRTGRVGARNLLVPTGVAGIAVAVLVQQVVSDPGQEMLRDAASVGLLTQLALIIAALTAMLAPSARRWFRRARALR